MLQMLCKEIDKKTECMATIDEVVEIFSNKLYIDARAEGYRLFDDPDDSVGYRGGLKDEDITITILSVYEEESGDEIMLEQFEYKKEY